MEIEEWRTPTLVRSFANIRENLTALACAPIPLSDEDKELIKQLHAKLDRVVNELRKRGILD